jgi:hydrogenase maturation protein HypF
MPPVRLGVTIRGVVQGVGFRPFVHAAATCRGLSGWVRNRSDGLALEVQGAAGAVRDFVELLRHERPLAARIGSMDVVDLVPAEADGFHILPSTGDVAVRATLPADLAVCPECTAEIADPRERRHRYPFTNCTCCGPRFSVVEALPYDRARTVMREFALCDACAHEYGDRGDRRSHAQPIACPACGPTLRLLNGAGRALASGDAALRAAVDAVCAGRVLALKGLGGFQLVVDATDPAAVARLRARKRRPDKPFAVLFASLAAVRAVCATSPAEEAWLAAPEGPILLVARRPAGAVATAVAVGVAPGNPHLGAMLPCTPLHRLLAEGTGRPLVCTSGNLSDEPICIDEGEAQDRLAEIADLFLVHDRRIVRPVDDSVARVGGAGLEVLRRARGFAPMPLAVPGLPAGIVALGAQLKNTVAVSLADEVVVSQHLGDLQSAEGALLLERTVTDLVRLFGVRARLVACDLHPDYASTQLAVRLAGAWDVPLERVQHHHAHIAACLAEHAVSGPVLGLAWDGAGLGVDGTLWGGEALVVDGRCCRRVAHLRPFPLPGGERAMREPRRAALGLLHAIAPERARTWARRDFSAAESCVLLAMLERGLGCPQTTSIGRLFDAVAALAGLRAVAGFEGQAAIELEHAADGVASDGAYTLPLGSGVPAVVDWEPLVVAVLRDLERGVPVSVVAARFHAALVDLAEAIAVHAGLARVALTGGCFQNLRLARTVRARLAARGFAVLAPRLYPPNDGAIALGQVIVAAARWREETSRVSGHSG